MRRALRRMALMFLLGLITNVALACALAARKGSLSPAEYPSPGGATVFNGGQVCIQRGLGARRWSVQLGGIALTGMWTPRTIAEYESGLVTKALAQGVSAGTIPPWWGTVPDTRPRQNSWLWGGAIQDVRGWPLPALGCQWTFWAPWPDADDPNWPTTLPAATLAGGVELPASRNGLRALPYRPVWAGLLGNSAVYALVWWATLFGFAATRRGLRRRRAQCPACGYSRSGLAAGAACPECGL
jgi:hypothetical protein